MNRYEKYKDSGIEWIGAIPKHWAISYVSKFFIERSEKVDDITYPPLSVTMSGIVDQLSNVAKTKNGDHRKLVKKDDFVINSRSDRKGSSGIAPRDGSVSLINIVLEPYEIEPQFIQHLFKSYYFKEEYFRNGKGIHWDIWSTGWDQLKNIKISIPPLEEQKLISRYLDKKTNQIDSLVEKLQKKIELLKEQRIALINQYVTKGLDPTVEMKDSGIEWIGKIPKHWEINKLKFISHSGVQYGLNIESDSYHEVGIRFLRITDINANGTLKKDGGVFLPPENIPEEYFLKQNDILFSRSGGTVGKSTRIDLISYPMSFAGYLVKFSFDNEEVSKFIKWVTESSMYWNWIDLQIIQSTIQNVNGEKYSNFSFALPTEIEIADINNLLNKKTSMIDKTISKYEKKIDLLFEYRQSLISSVVTGKIRITEEML